MAIPENREMYTEIASLLATLAKALDLSESEAIAAVERGEIALDFGRDENANRYVVATYRGQTARVYQGAIKRPPGKR